MRKSVLKEFEEKKERAIPDLTVQIELFSEKYLDIADSSTFDIPGDLYQYCMSRDVSARRKTTELFTPAWIARWMLQNSLAVCISSKKNPESVTVFDPCVGCGILLLYAFDMLFNAYRLKGIPCGTAAELIVENSLFGADIDENACRLARFALLKKAVLHGASESVCTDALQKNIRQLKEYGSLEESFPAVSGKYDVVVTNPPYRKSGSIAPDLNKFLKRQYPDSCSDLYAVFIERCLQLTAAGGYTALLTQHTWMFLKRYASLRRKLAESVTLQQVLHLGPHAFEDIKGEVVQTAAFIMKKERNTSFRTQFIDLTEPRKTAGKEQLLLSETYRSYRCCVSGFAAGGGAYMYRASPAVQKAFASYPPLSTYGTTRQGVATGDNERFVRYWFEIPKEQTAYGCRTMDEFLASGKKYIPYAKSGGYCRWYGSSMHVLRFDSDAYSALCSLGNCLPSRPLFFRENINWTLISTDLFPARYFPAGGICDVGCHAFYSSDSVYDMLGYMNTVVFNHFIKMLNPTMNYSSGSVALVPCAPFAQDGRPFVEENVRLSRMLWDMHELSPDFTGHPLVCAAGSTDSSICLKDAVSALIEKYDASIACIQRNTERLNHLYLDIYHLEKELSPRVDDRYLCIHRQDTASVIRSLVSYITGCMFGRYRPDTAESTGDSYLTVQDMALRFTAYITELFGRNTAAENMAFIAEYLPGKRLPPQEKLASYYRGPFALDHKKLYRGCPVYWPAGGVERGIYAYLYYPRYTEHTLPDMLKEYASGTPVPDSGFMAALKHAAACPSVLDTDSGIAVNYKKIGSVLYCPLY